MADLVGCYLQSGNLSASALSNLRIQYPWMRGEHFQHDQTEIIPRLCRFWQKRTHGIVMNEIQQVYFRACKCKLAFP